MSCTGASGRDVIGGAAGDDGAPRAPTPATPSRQAGAGQGENTGSGRGKVAGLATKSSCEGSQGSRKGAGSTTAGRGEAGEAKRERGQGARERTAAAKTCEEEAPGGSPASQRKAATALQREAPGGPSKEPLRTRASPSNPLAVKVHATSHGGSSQGVAVFLFSFNFFFRAYSYWWNIADSSISRLCPLLNGTWKADSGAVEHGGFGNYNAPASMAASPDA